jgi:hypothetical protein
VVVVGMRQDGEEVVVEEEVEEEEEEVAGLSEAPHTSLRD